MAVRPRPILYTCPKCNTKSIHHPASDALDMEDMLAKICKKCKVSMQGKSIDIPPMQEVGIGLKLAVFLSNLFNKKS